MPRLLVLPSPPKHRRSSHSPLPQLLRHLFPPSVPRSHRPALLRRFPSPLQLLGPSPLLPPLPPPSFLPHSSRRPLLRRGLFSHSPVRSNPSALRHRPPLVIPPPARLNRSILLHRPPPDHLRPNHSRNQALAAPSCLGRLPLRSSSHLRPSLQHPRLNHPLACSPQLRPPLSKPLPPSLLPWKKFRPSPLRQLQLQRRSLFRVACSAPRR